MKENKNFQIAKYMGYNYPNINNETWKASYDILHRYDKDWNLLMSVLEKISNTNYHDLSTGCLRTFNMKNEETGFPMVRINRCPLFTAPTLIEATWLAVSDFVKNHKYDLDSTI